MSLSARVRLAGSETREQLRLPDIIAKYDKNVGFAVG
jgi:hypothetical protein